MSEEQRHHLFHHKKEEVSADADNSGYVEYGGEDKARKEEKHHKHLEHDGEFGAAAAGGFALVYFILCIYTEYM